ncbi:hypothetical protein M9458_023617, partial [Cirrhinus mrigala]
HSDGSTETLSVAAMEETDEVGSLSTVQTAPLRNSLLSSSSLRDSFSTNDSKTLECDLVTTDLDPESRSLSIDSAYGTLSPQSLITELDLKGTVCQSEGEETDAGEEEEAFEDEEDGDEEDSITWNGSQITVNESYVLDGHASKDEKNNYSGTSQVPGCRSHTLRRRSPVQPRPDYLEYFALRSRSEDDLLQCLTGPLRPSGRNNMSKSLTHLAKQTSHNTELFQTDEEDLHEDPNMLSSKLTNILRRAEARHVQRTLSCPNGQANCEIKENETTPSGGLEEKRDLVLSQQPHQQHKKLTVAQLHRIRATMVLNSTLTAS